MRIAPAPMNDGGVVATDLKEMATTTCKVASTSDHALPFILLKSSIPKDDL